ncbi:aspartate/glutamate racemase family protein [Pacificoceanicola onchidii]|uniref:maleate cis-trans isomerase family protein n=1 Tax=Pacificoceanicola onchidii TaxID=2562685 RepID=UPI0010A52666|nr:aspartate/glutamate racemase family protein [Pacificoceanicola onchidii]
MSRVFPYTLGPPIGTRANLGLVVLQPDETLEHDCRRLLPQEGVALYVSRIVSGTEVSTDSLGAMEARLPEAAGRLPEAVSFDVVGYGCTSATAVIGAPRVSALVREGCSAQAVTEPLSALVAACGALEVTRLALLSPYVAEVSDGLRRALSAQGIETPTFGSFDEAVESRVARIDEASLMAAGRALMADGDAEALFLSCTNLRTLGVLEALEQETGKPVLSSNQVLIWHMLRLAGVADRVSGYGRLFRDV